MTPDEFLSAQPFPHLVREGFLASPIAAAAAAEFDRLPPEAWHVYDGHDRDDAGKRACRHWPAFGPACRRMLEYLTGAAGVKLVEHLSGVPDLVADRTLYGGGLHGMPPGTRLGIHLDNELHPETGMMRRLNLILYLSDAAGGELRLWDRARKNYKAIEPRAGRLVLMECGSHTFHSVAEVTGGIERRSLAVYFWSPLRSRALFLPPTGPAAP